MPNTNEIRRVRNKLKILELEGSGQLLNEAMNIRLNTSRTVPNEEVMVLLKAMYTNYLNDLLREGPLEQGTLDLKD